MLTKLYSKYAGVFIKIIGSMSFLVGSLLIGYAWLECLFSHHVLEQLGSLFFLVFMGYTFINGIVFIQYKTPLSWSVLVVHLVYWISFGLSFGVRYFYWNLLESNTANTVFFIEGLILVMLLFIPLMVVLHSVFIEIYEVSFKRVVVSISLGILLFLMKSYIHYGLIG